MSSLASVSVKPALRKIINESTIDVKMAFVEVLEGDNSGTPKGVYPVNEFVDIDDERLPEDAPDSAVTAVLPNQEISGFLYPEHTDLTESVVLVTKATGYAEIKVGTLLGLFYTEQDGISLYRIIGMDGKDYGLADLM